jgi:hypothetical protein
VEVEKEAELDPLLVLLGLLSLVELASSSMLSRRFLSRLSFSRSLFLSLFSWSFFSISVLPLLPFGSPRGL